MSNAPLKGWNNTPDVPLKVSPIFTWPLRAAKMLTWVWGSWLLLTEKRIVLGLACISLISFQPSLAETQTLA